MEGSLGGERGKILPLGHLLHDHPAAASTTVVILLPPAPLAPCCSSSSVLSAARPASPLAKPSPRPRVSPSPSACLLEEATTRHHHIDKEAGSRREGKGVVVAVG